MNSASQVDGEDDDDVTSMRCDPLREAVNQMRHVIGHLLVASGVRCRQVLDSLVEKRVLNSSDRESLVTATDQGKQRGQGDSDSRLFEAVLDRVIDSESGRSLEEQKKIIEGFLTVVGQQVKDGAWIADDVERRRQEIVRTRDKMRQMKLQRDSKDPRVCCFHAEQSVVTLSP